MEAPATGISIIERMEEYMFFSGEDSFDDSSSDSFDDSFESSNESSDDDYLNCIDCDSKTYREFCRNQRCEDCHDIYYSICRKYECRKCECFLCKYEKEKDDLIGTCKMCKSFSHKFYIDSNQEITLCYKCIHHCVSHGINNEDFHPLFLDAAKKITDLELFITLGLQIKEITTYPNPISLLPPELMEMIIKEVIFNNHKACIELSYIKYEYFRLELSPTKVDLFYGGINLADYSKSGYFYAKIEPSDLPAIIFASGSSDWWIHRKHHDIKLNGDEENLLTSNRNDNVIPNVVKNNITNNKNNTQCLKNNYKSYHTNNRKNNWRR